MAWKEVSVDRALVRQELAALDLLRSIIMQSRGTANTITFEKPSCEQDKNASALRQETDRCRQALFALFGNTYLLGSGLECLTPLVFSATKERQNTFSVDVTCSRR